MAGQSSTTPRPVQWLLRVCEQVTDRVVVRWSLLIDVVLIAGHAFSRKFFGVAHNFVLGMAGYTLKRNEHVRIDSPGTMEGEKR